MNDRNVESSHNDSVVYERNMYQIDIAKQMEIIDDNLKKLEIQLHHETESEGSNLEINSFRKNEDHVLSPNDFFSTLTSTDTYSLEDNLRFKANINSSTTSLEFMMNENKKLLTEMSLIDKNMLKLSEILRDVAKHMENTIGKNKSSESDSGRNEKTKADNTIHNGKTYSDFKDYCCTGVKYVVDEDRGDCSAGYGDAPSMTSEELNKEMPLAEEDDQNKTESLCPNQGQNNQVETDVDENLYTDNRSFSDYIEETRAEFSRWSEMSESAVDHQGCLMNAVATTCPVGGSVSTTTIREQLLHDNELIITSPEIEGSQSSQEEPPRYDDDDHVDNYYDYCYYSQDELITQMFPISDVQDKRPRSR